MKSHLSLLQDKQSQLSLSFMGKMLDFLFTFVALPECPCHSCTGKIRTEHNPPGVGSAALNKAGGSIPELLTTHCLKQHGIPFVFFAARAHSGSYWTWFPPGSHSPFLQSCFPGGCTLHGVVLPQVQKLAPPRVELHEVPVEEPFGVPLDDSATLWHTIHLSEFSTVCKLAESTVCYIIQITDDVKEHWTQYWLLGWITSHCPPVRLGVTDHHTNLPGQSLYCTSLSSWARMTSPWWSHVDYY